MNYKKPLRLEHLSTFDIEELQLRYPYLYQNYMLLKSTFDKSQLYEFKKHRTDTDFFKGSILLIGIPVLILSYLFFWRDDVAEFTGPIVIIILEVFCFTNLMAVTFSFVHSFYLDKSNQSSSEIKKTIGEIFLSPWSITEKNEIIESKWMVFIQHIKISYLNGCIYIIKNISLEEYLSIKYKLALKPELKKIIREKAKKYAIEFKTDRTKGNKKKYSEDDIAYVMEIHLEKPDLEPNAIFDQIKHDPNRPDVFKYKDGKTGDKRIESRIIDWTNFVLKKESSTHKLDK